MPTKFICIHLMQIYAVYNIHVILNEGPVWKNPLSFTWYTLQVLFEVTKSSVLPGDPITN